MCVFCAVATQTSGRAEVFEKAGMTENLLWAIGLCVWLFLLYKGYQRTKMDVHSSHKAFSELPTRT